MAIALLSGTTNPAYNLATEAFLLQQKTEDVVFLYENEASVVLGKHQNAFYEANQAFCKSNNVEVHRRLSGGGTVYHGPGNLNFCLIKNLKDKTKLIDFEKFLRPVMAYLHTINLPVTYSGRNDLLLNGFKVSGNAEHVDQRRKRVLHHGTLLFNANLSSLKGAIQPKETIHFEGHSIASVRSEVANLEAYLNPPINLTEFKSGLFNHLVHNYGASNYNITDVDAREIGKLVDEKFNTWDWNYGYSPKFKAQLQDFGHQEVLLEIDVVKGQMESMRLGYDGNFIPIDVVHSEPFTPENILKITDWSRFKFFYKPLELGDLSKYF
ncbi:MAG: lipoate-protein ligase A [Bacteroidia bacterium]|jgi:lipoate-protein ligase A